MTKFFEEEKIRSSTELLTNVYEEWDNVFAKDVNLVLLKTFINIVKDVGMLVVINWYFAFMNLNSIVRRSNEKV